MTVIEIFVLSVVVLNASVFGMHVPAPVMAPAPAPAMAPAGFTQPQAYIPDVSPVSAHLRGLPEAPEPAPPMESGTGEPATWNEALANAQWMGAVLEEDSGESGDDAVVQGRMLKNKPKNKTQKKKHKKKKHGEEETSAASSTPNMFLYAGKTYDLLMSKVFKTNNKQEINALRIAMIENPSLLQKYIRYEEDSNLEDIAEI